MGAVETWGFIHTIGLAFDEGSRQGFLALCVRSSRNKVRQKYVIEGAILVFGHVL